jgi:opacity protein-like surface antigen
MKTWLLVLFAAAAATAPADAAIVYLKDGSRLQGTVVSATAAEIQLYTGAGTIDIDAARVQRIDYADAPPPPQSEEGPAYSAPPVFRRRPRREPWESAPARDMLSIDVGLDAPLTGVSIPGSGGDTTSNGDVGPLVGVEYLHSLTPLLSVGADFEYMYRSPTATPNLLPGAISNVSGNTEMLLAVAKLALTDRGYARPYLLAGLGVDNTSTLIDATPRPGFAWPDTGTSESRTLVDGSSWGLASTLRFGIDFNVYDPVVFSVEAGWTALDNGRVAATSSAQSVGLSGLSGPLDFFTVAGRWGWRF